MNKNKAPSRITFACSRGFAIPEAVIADMLSARVADPQLFSLWIRKSTGTKQSTGTNVVIVPVRILHFLTFFDHLLTVTTINDQNRTLPLSDIVSLQ